MMRCVISLSHYAAELPHYGFFLFYMAQYRYAHWSRMPLFFTIATAVRFIYRAFRNIDAAAMSLRHLVLGDDAEYRLQS